MTKTMHPADAADRAKIATATHFSVHMRFGPHDKINQEAATLEAAVTIADDLASRNKGKIPLIYAVTPEKFTVLVPKDIIAAARPGGEQPEELSNIEIAKLTAIITGGGYKRSNSKAAAVARFVRVAADAGIKSETAIDIVKGPYDMAEHVIREALAGKPLAIADVKAVRSTDDMSLGEIADKIDAGKSASRKTVQTDDGPVFPATKPAGGKRAALLEAAQRGEIPAAPNFMAETHKRFRKKLGEIVALVEAGNIEGLKAMVINPVSSSPKAMAKYRDLAVIALEARHQKVA